MFFVLLLAVSATTIAGAGERGPFLDDLEVYAAPARHLAGVEIDTPLLSGSAILDLHAPPPLLPAARPTAPTVPAPTAEDRGAVAVEVHQRES